MNDGSDQFAEMRRDLNQETDNGYQRFLQQLKPDYRRVWLDIGLGYAMLVAGVLALCLLPGDFLFAVPGAILGAAWIGYWMAYLGLFIHEAAHYNIYPTREGNDRLCNVFLSVWGALWVKQYRLVHFPHHRCLGTPEDTENSYFNALTPRFLLELLLGVHALRVIRQRMKMPKPAVAEKPDGKPLLISLLIHAAIILALALSGYYAATVAWILGMGMFFPFFGALRQILEHRDENADPAKDFRQEPHGGVTRVFSGGFFTETFGGAGFARHLLHHWEPQVSYTCLGELEKFIEGTSLNSILAARRTTYAATMRQLLKAGHA